MLHWQETTGHREVQSVFSLWECYASFWHMASGKIVKRLHVQNWGVPLTYLEAQVGVHLPVLTAFSSLFPSLPIFWYLLITTFLCWFIYTHPVSFSICPLSELTWKNNHRTNKTTLPGEAAAYIWMRKGPWDGRAIWRCFILSLLSPIF